jgi:SNF2 family DNA or RNA helicase
LPPRTTEIVRIPPTDEQLEIDQAQMQIVSTIVSKKYISEMDLLRLQKALLLARMNADSTFLVDKRAPGYSTKLERLEELFEELAGEESRKIVLFSEWATMLTLIERRIKRFNLDYVRLDGSVPQKKRQQLVHQFQRNPALEHSHTMGLPSGGPKAARVSSPRSGDHERGALRRI